MRSLLPTIATDRERSSVMTTSTVRVRNSSIALETTRSAVLPGLETSSRGNSRGAPPRTGAVPRHLSHGPSLRLLGGVERGNSRRVRPFAMFRVVASNGWCGLLSAVWLKVAESSPVLPFTRWWTSALREALGADSAGPLGRAQTRSSASRSVRNPDALHEIAEATCDGVLGDPPRGFNVQHADLREPSPQRAPHHPRPDRHARGSQPPATWCRPRPCRAARRSPACRSSAARFELERASPDAVERIAHALLKDLLRLDGMRGRVGKGQLLNKPDSQ